MQSYSCHMNRQPRSIMTRVYTTSRGIDLLPRASLPAHSGFGRLCQPTHDRWWLSHTHIVEANRAGSGAHSSPQAPVQACPVAPEPHRTMQYLLTEATSPDNILQLVVLHGHQCSAEDSVTALQRYAQLAPAGQGQLRNHHPDYVFLLALISQHAQHFRPHAQAIVLWAHAHLGMQPTPDLMQQLLPFDNPGRAAQQQAASFCDQQSTPVMPSIGCWPGSLVHASSAVPPRPPHGYSGPKDMHGLVQADVQETIDLLQACVRRSSDPGSAAMAAACQRMQQDMPNSSPQQVACFARACAALEHNPGVGLLSAATAQLHRTLPAAGPRDIADFLWACASMAFRPGYAFLAAAAARLQRLISRASPEDAAKYVWACSTLRFQPGHASLAAVAAQVQSRLADADLEPLCTLICASARCGHQLDVAFNTAAIARMEQVLVGHSGLGHEHAGHWKPEQSHNSGTDSLGAPLTC